MPASDSSIVPRKTVLGSYIIMRHLASGGMGTVWEGWVNPYAELGTNMIKGGSRDLRSLAGVKSRNTTLGPADIQKIRLWVRERTAEFVNRPDPMAAFSQSYTEMLEYIAPHRRVGGGFRRAIKVLDEQLAVNEKVVQRFIKEVDILARTLDHPCVIKVVESGHAAGKYYAVMEFIDTLDLETEKLTIPQATRVAREALEGLIHAHEQGILHRDIKPANILATRDFNKIKLSDFGIAKALDETSDGKLTSTGVIVGTPHYMDPERARGESMGTESDVYALGATFYKLLSGKPPVLGASPIDTMGQIGHEKDVTWVRTHNPQVSEELEDVVMMMLAKDRRARPTAYEIRALLARVEKRNQLFYQEPTENQRRQNEAAAEKARREARKLRAQCSKGSDAERASAAARYYAKVAERVDLMPRADAAAVSVRLDLLRETLDFHKTAFEGRSGEAVAKATAGASLPSKMAALEKRRLEKSGFEYVVRKPRKLGRKALVALAGAIIIAMAVLFTLTVVQRQRTLRAVDDALGRAQVALERKDIGAARRAFREAGEAARDLPQSAAQVQGIAEFGRRLDEHEAYAEAERLHGEVERSLAARTYSKASQEISALLRALEKLREPLDPTLGEHASALRRRVEEDQKRITRYASDINVYSGLIGSFRQVRAEFERLKADRTGGKPVVPTAVAALADQVSKIQAKLKDPKLINPDAIGPELKTSLAEVERTAKELAKFKIELEQEPGKPDEP